jgi:hypothetical protein
MKIGSIWVTPDRKQFQVTDIKLVDNQKWIYYNNVSSKQEYHCLVEAFIDRFTEKVNNG